SEQAAGGAHGTLPGIHQQETTSAVRILGFARSEAGLTHQRSLLVAQDSGDRNSRGSTGFHRTVGFAAGANLRQHSRGNAERVQQVFVPGKRIEVHQLSAAGVGDVGDVKPAVGPAGQVPGEKGIDVAENYLAGFRFFPDAGHMLEQPADFQAAEVGAERQASLGPKAVSPTFARKLCDVVLYSSVLPDQGVGHGLAGLPLPQHGSLTLVSDPDRGQVGGAKLTPLQRLRNHILRGLPDFRGIVLYPPRLRINLLVLLLRRRYYLAGGVKHTEARTGRALIDCPYVVGHAGYGNGGWGIRQRLHHEKVPFLNPYTSGTLAPTFLVP